MRGTNRSYVYHPYHPRKNEPKIVSLRNTNNNKKYIYIYDIEEEILRRDKKKGEIKKGEGKGKRESKTNFIPLNCLGWSRTPSRELLPSFTTQHRSELFFISSTPTDYYSVGREKMINDGFAIRSFAIEGTSECRRYVAHSSKPIQSHSCGNIEWIEFGTRIFFSHTADPAIIHCCIYFYSKLYTFNVNSSFFCFYTTPSILRLQLTNDL